MTEDSLKPYVIGLDLGGTNSVFGIVDSRGDIKATTAIKTQGYGDNVEAYVDASIEALKIIIDQVGGIDKSHKGQKQDVVEMRMFFHIKMMFVIY